MADNVQFQSTELATPASGTTVSTDEAASGHVQRVKLAYSANGADTHVTADADGLLVNLGANNDVTVTGTVAVTGTFYQATQPVSIASAVPVTDNNGSLTVDNGGTFAVQAAQSGTWNLNNIAGTISLPTGAATETSVAAAASGSNLRVTPVNQTPISSSAAMVASVAASATNVTLLSAVATRVGFAVYNDSASVCYLKFGATASSTSFTVLLSGGAYYEYAGHGVYTGQVDAIWATATGSARVTSW